MRKSSRRVSPKGSGENCTRYCWPSTPPSSPWCPALCFSPFFIPDCCIVIGDWLIWCHHPSAGCTWSHGNTLKKHRDVSEEGEILEAFDLCAKQVWSHPHLGHGKIFATCWSLLSHVWLRGLCFHDTKSQHSAPLNFIPETVGCCFVPRVPHSGFPC